MPYFLIFVLFFWVTVLTLFLAQPLFFSELAGATKSGIKQQISNKKALNFCATFIRLCWSGFVSLIDVHYSWANKKPSNFTMWRIRKKDKGKWWVWKNDITDVSPDFSKVRWLFQFPRRDDNRGAIAVNENWLDTLSRGWNANYCVCSTELAFLQPVFGVTISERKFICVPLSLGNSGKYLATRQRQSCVAYERATLHTDITVGLWRNRLRGGEQNNRKYALCYVK